MMSKIDRVMAAYNRRHALSPEMDVRVRAELIPFIASLVSGQRHGEGNVSLVLTVPAASDNDVLKTPI